MVSRVQLVVGLLIGQLTVINGVGVVDTRNAKFVPVKFCTSLFSFKLDNLGLANVSASRISPNLSFVCSDLTRNANLLFVGNEFRCPTERLHAAISVGLVQNLDIVHVVRRVISEGDLK